MKRYIYIVLSIFIKSPMKRTSFWRRRNIFNKIGEHCMIYPRIIPLYPHLITLGDNVWVASGVQFITHDVVHHMLNYMYKDHTFKEQIGQITIGNNVFIGAKSQILYNVQIGSNVIVAAGSLVTQDLPDNGVYAGVPAKKISTFENFVNKRILNSK